MRRSREECLDALRTAAEVLGKSPSKSQYERLGLTPASATIIRTVGGWNQAKEAAGLSTSPSRGPRVEEPPADLELPEDVVWSKLSVDQRWHYRNREWNTERTLRRRASLRRWLADEKRKTGCAHCEESDPACLVFHHVDTKEMAVNKMVPSGYSKERIREEIGRCQVLCSNCHRKSHLRSKQFADLECKNPPDSLPARQDGVPQTEQENPRRASLQRCIWSEKLKREGCVRCGEDHLACLEFHHRDPATKVRSISEMVSHEVSIEELEQEMGKCDLLCSNCHRREHHHQPTKASETQD